MREGAWLVLLAVAGCAPGAGPETGDAGADRGAAGPPPATAPLTPPPSNPSTPPSTPSPSAPAATPPATTPPGDAALIARLEREARALARADGCSSAAACRTAPVGSRPCGGPRDYVVFCAATTDTVELFAKLAELRRVEEAYNREQGMMSTCEFRSPPGVGLAGGVCRAASTDGRATLPRP